ncbi:MAG TPA: hypothetical protein VFS83_14840 [Ktedonobacterales bacterium]|nr:hypothetical protein [Ktedonobacterales bacterium]
MGLKARRGGIAAPYVHRGETAIRNSPSKYSGHREHAMSRQLNYLPG